MSRVLPILFNTDMVRAILDGRKTVTRRIIKPQPIEGHYTFVYCSGDNHIKTETGIIKPPYQPGDILYVRETWCKTDCFGACDGYVYRTEKADALKILEETTGFVPKWHPSIHMPKEAARIWLKVKDVRVERLQEITEEQAKAEGIRGYSKDGNLYKYAVTDDWWIDYHNKHRKSFLGTWWQDMSRTAKDAFSYLWNSTIKKSDLDRYGWDANPYVWVTEFEQCENMVEMN